MQYFANMQTHNALSFFEWCMMMQKSTVEFDFTFFALSSLIVYLCQLIQGLENCRAWVHGNIIMSVVKKTPNLQDIKTNPNFINIIINLFQFESEII